MRKFHAAIAAGVSLFAIAPQAYAQDKPDDTQATDDAVAPGGDIVVTARRRDESVQDVPQTVNVVTAAEIQKLNLRNFQDIQTVVPGLNLVSNSAFSNQATVRGIAFAPEASGNNPSVEFYLNDAPISSAFLFQSTFDLGQFELQRGPQGTLRGRAAPSGAIAVTTRRPNLDEVGLAVNGSLSDIKAYKLDGAVNIPIIKGMLAVRLAGVVDENQTNRVRSFYEGIGPDYSKAPFRKTRAYRASVRFEPTDWLSANVMYQNLRTRDHTYNAFVSTSLIDPTAVATASIVNGTDYTPIIRPFDRLALDEQGSWSTQKQDLLIGNLDIRFAGQKLSYVGAYNKQDNKILAAQDNGDFFSPVRGLAILARLPADPVGFDQVCTNAVLSTGGVLSTGSYDQCTHTVAKRRSHELRLSSETRIGGIFDYVIGAFYDHNDNPTNLTTETPVLSSISSAVIAGTTPARLLTTSRTAILRRGTSTEKSLFGNLTAHLLDDRLELSGGLRYISFKNNSLPTLQGSSSGTLPCAELTTLTCSALGVGDTSKTNATIYTLSAKYKITPDVMVYALTGSSWRPGPKVVGDFSTAQSVREQSFLNLPPEKSKSYEVGLKTSFMNRKGRFNLAFYHQTFDNYPFRGPSVFYVSTSTSTGTAVQSVANFNFVSPVPVTVNGVEGEFSYQFSDRFSIGLNASYADGKIKNGTIACNDLNGDGVPDINPATPTLLALQTAVGAGQTISQCSGINRRSTFTPKFSANLQGEYNANLGANTQGFLRGLVTYYGKTEGDPDNAYDQVGAYGIVNLFAGLRAEDGSWELTAFAKNVTNTQKVLSVGGTVLTTSLRSATASGTFASQYRSVSVTAPREFGVSMRIALGSR